MFIDLKNVEIDCIKVDARWGATVDDCVLDCVLLSYKTDSDIILKHNTKLYSFDNKKIKEFIQNKSMIEISEYILCEGD